MAEKAKWQLSCKCWVDATSFVKMCKKHQEETDLIHQTWKDDYKRLSTEFDKQCERHAKEKINPTPKPVPEAKVRNGDLTSMM